MIYICIYYVYEWICIYIYIYTYVYSTLSNIIILATVMCFSSLTSIKLYSCLIITKTHSIFMTCSIHLAIKMAQVFQSDPQATEPYPNRKIWLIPSLPVGGNQLFKLPPLWFGWWIEKFQLNPEIEMHWRCFGRQMHPKWWVWKRWLRL